MTNSILMSYYWYKDCPFEWKQSALEKLKNTIYGVYSPTRATLRGTQYEDKINKYLNYNTEFLGKEKVFEELRGSIQQGWIKPLRISTNKGTYEFRGKYDYKKDHHLYDLKTTSSTINPDYYTKSFQHSIYGLAENCHSFTYLVTQIDPRFHVIDLQKINVEIDKEKDTLRLTEALIEFEKGLEKLDLWNLYLQKKCGIKINDFQAFSAF